jgi:hypothetical protein
MSLLLHCLALHARRKTLDVAAVLTAIALSLVDFAVTLVTTRVGEVLANGALEKALASLTAVHAIVLSASLYVRTKFVLKLIL